MLLADPLRTLAHDASLLVHGKHLGTALHLPWVVLPWSCWWRAATRWPASYTAFAFCILAVALTASNLDSFERYALSAFPLVLGAASLMRSSRVRDRRVGARGGRSRLLLDPGVHRCLRAVGPAPGTGYPG